MLLQGASVDGVVMTTRSDPSIVKWNVDVVIDGVNYTHPAQNAVGLFTKRKAACWPITLMVMNFICTMRGSMQYRNRQLISGFRPCPTTSGDAKHAARAQPNGMTPYVKKVLAEMECRQHNPTKDVLDYVRQRTATTRRIAKDLKIPEKQVLKALRVLVNRGLVEIWISRRNEWGANAL